MKVILELSDPEDGMILSSDSEFSEDELREGVGTGNLLNQSMHQMYKTSSNSRRNSEDEIETPLAVGDIVKNGQTLLEQNSQIYRNEKNSSPLINGHDIPSKNVISKCSSPKSCDVATGSQTSNTNSERPALTNENAKVEKQNKKSSRKEGTPSRSVKKTASKDILSVDTEKIPSVPEVKFCDLGGCGGCIQEVCKLLIHVKHPEVFNTLGITPPRGFLLHGPPGCGKSLFAHAIAGEIEVPIIDVASTEMVSGISGESEGKIRDVFKRACAHSPCVLFLDEIDAITPKRETASREMERRIVAQLLSCLDELNRNKEVQVLVIGATNRPDSLDPALRRAGRFDREIKMGIPDEQAREEILRVQCKDLKLNEEFDFKTLASQTPGFVGADLTALVREAAIRAVTRIFSDVGTDVNTNDKPGDIMQRNVTDLLKSSQASFSEEQLKDLCIRMEDFTQALRDVQPSAKREGFATIPDVTWDDIGALKDVREELTMAIIAPVRHRNAFTQLGLTNPPGILLAGPPGCGKTLLAKAIANESGINFISVKGPELLNMYVGESERAVRQVFQRARNSAPCVIFFDELDALCPRRSHSAESTASARVVNQLLTEMDGLETRKQVFIMGATNRPDIIDPAILRPGRLDKILYVGLPQEKDRLAILQTLTKGGTKPTLLSDVHLETIAADERCSGFSGADLAALVREASVNSLRERMKGYQGTSGLMLDANGPDVIQQDTIVGVAMRHFDAAFKKIKPSVSEKDQLVYKYMQERMETDNG
ncbi:nuclear valosin-containing protein-like isoform X2 [Dendronephthya gigantea]|uniref:nuclear valosin-containing protein-like isoform X2 n=1 Tax=Dendronephthya gigantea TaxID=151771 RepID=UPI00106A85E3|nr:nuclear valosin-containing protein-like isoform X2 [Dendronephthya gigantea]